MSSGLLDHPPTDDELARLYWELAQLGAPSVGKKVPWSYSPDSPESLLAMAGDMLRYNPRLLSILLQFIVEHWDCLNPRALRESMAKIRWPQALLVVFEFAKIASSKRELHWFVEYVSAGMFARDPAEKFFFDAERPGSRIAKRHAGSQSCALPAMGLRRGGETCEQCLHQENCGRLRCVYPSLDSSRTF